MSPALQDLEEYFQFREQLQALFGHPVDLVMAGAVRKMALLLRQIRPLQPSKRFLPTHHIWIVVLWPNGTVGKLVR
jgi:hypothetical protein